MSTRQGFKVAALAASIALAIGSTAVMAAAPAANQLPGQGAVAAGAIDATTTGVSLDGKTLNVVLTADSVINWGTGTAINKTGTAGFNIGADAKVAFSGGNVLNVDTTGNPSQIFGALTAVDNVFVANANGIIVGTGATITGGSQVGLIANTLGATTAFAGVGGGDVYALEFNGTGGDVTVQPGATIGATATLISGGGNVNVDLGGVTGAVALLAGWPFPLAGGGFATKNAAATLTVTGSSTGSTVASLISAGTATTNGKVIITAAAAADVLTNNGDLTVDTIEGAVHNQGQLTTTGNSNFKALTNDGAFSAGGNVTLDGGDLVNNGGISGAGGGIVVGVMDGSVVNNGTMANIHELTTSSTVERTAGADYSITNTGTILGAAIGLTIVANGTASRYLDPANTTTGSVSNTGKLQVAVAGNALGVGAWNDVALGGLLQINDGTIVKAISPDNPLGIVEFLAETGTLTVATPVATNSIAMFGGNQVKLMDNVTVGTAAVPAGILQITAGDAPDGDYAVRVASGKTVSAGSVSVQGTDKTNVILQGTLAGNSIQFGVVPTPISDVVTGPAGGLLATGATPAVAFAFNGRIKTVPYLNASNFRYNYLPINVTVAATTPLALLLYPADYQTKGTSNGLSGVNILVDGDVGLNSGMLHAAPTSAVTGVTHWENTHLVLQSTGDIATAGAFFWPGYVYLGNIDADTSGNALPGTLGDGTITLNGDFNNVLPGNVDGAGGIHFITTKALATTGPTTVTTNANSWINFGTDLLTQNYAQGILTSPTFAGGTQGSGSVVNYGELDASVFHTHAPDATK